MSAPRRRKENALVAPECPRISSQRRSVVRWWAGISTRAQNNKIISQSCMQNVSYVFLLIQDLFSQIRTGETFFIESTEIHIIHMILHLARAHLLMSALSKYGMRFKLNIFNLTT